LSFTLRGHCDRALGDLHPRFRAECSAADALTACNAV